MDIIKQYINLKNEIKSYFNYEEDYFIKSLINFNWTIQKNDGIYLLTYWNDNNKIDTIIVKKNNEPLIYKTKTYTAIIAIDCVKIAFILKNDNKE